LTRRRDFDHGPRRSVRRAGGFVLVAFSDKWNLAQLMVAVGISPSDGLANLELEHFPFAKSNTAIRTARHQIDPMQALRTE
jgi:hypothetical protein